jgi:rubrerythrin
VYCAVGGRSKVAAQFLAGLDFPVVLNMAGGIKAWQGQQAFEEEASGLELLIGAEDFSDSVSLAYKMEDGLQKFYQTLADRAVDDQQKNLYVRLGSFEEKHKLKLRQQYQNLGQENVAQEDTDHNICMEGGYKISELIARAEAANRTQIDILEMAMMLETQALDLYSRMARNSEGSSRKLFFDLANEENAHLSYLTKEFERLLK